jgi:hypothetical protein
MIIRVAEQDAQTHGLKMVGLATADLNGDGDGSHATVPADQKVKCPTTKKTAADRIAR